MTDATEVTEPFQVHRRFTIRTIGQIASSAILILASIAFIAGGAAKPSSLGGIVFIALGIVGIAAFGAALGAILAPVLGRRPLLVLDDDGVHAPVAWPRSRRAGRTLPWQQVKAVCVVDRGVATGKGVRHYLAFLPSEETAEAARTAPKAQLIALTLPDVPTMTDAVPWTFSVDPDWSSSVKEIVEAARGRGVPIIDRRKK